MRLQSGSRVLAADVGGTKVELAVFEWRRDCLVPRDAKAYASIELTGLAPALKDFLTDDVSVCAAVFGVAGPVQEGRAQITNLPWAVDTDEMRDLLGISSVRVINDLEATAYGVLTLRSEDVLVLNSGHRQPGNMAIIAAGTGLGEGLLFWDGVAHHPSPSEGGHADLAPRDRVQEELLTYLRQRFGHVSWERVLSGRGLVNIYEFLRDSGGGQESAEVVLQRQTQDAAAVISRAALAGKCALCVRALDLFVALYGAEAGNLALKVMATEGIYVAGGIAPKIRSKLIDGTFMAGFRDKGRLQSLMDRMPVFVVLKETTALYGAGFCAARMAQREGE